MFVELTALFSVMIILLAWGVRIFIVVLLIKALLKYLNDKKATPEQEIIRRSLGEALKAHRQNCGMTQEYVAEALGVSRQAVSKWETGAAEPSTSNFPRHPSRCLRDIRPAPSALLPA